jgi:membrane carboxypeptidase/penicillin-binding protein PbpC
MHLCRSWIACGALTLAWNPFAAHAAIVYKWTDADGVVHFSDQPVPGAEKIVTTGPSRIGTVPGGLGRAAAPQAKPTPPATPLSLSIDSPGNEQTITGNQPVKVHLALSPDLKPTQAITWYLNGSPLTNQAPDATQFTLEDLARGTYTLGATVVDQATGEAKSAQPVTFYVMRTTLLSPQHKGSP